MAVSNITQFTRQVRAIQRSIGNTQHFFRHEALPLTILEIRRLIERQRIIRTGRFLRAATQTGHPGNLLRITNAEMEIGVDLRWFERETGAGYPLFVTQGTRYIQPRPVYSAVAGSEVYEQKLLGRYEQWLNQQIRKADR